MPDTLTPAELADGLAVTSDPSRLATRALWWMNHGETALRELAALRSQLAETKAIEELQVESLKRYDRKIENQRKEINRLIKAADEAQRTSEWCQRQLATMQAELDAYKARLAKTNEELESTINRAWDHCLDAEIYLRKLEGADANWADAVSQLAAEREKRAALVREWRANADERCDEVAQRLLRHCADQLEDLDKETGDA